MTRADVHKVHMEHLHKFIVPGLPKGEHLKSDRTIQGLQQEDALLVARLAQRSMYRDKF